MHDFYTVRETDVGKQHIKWHGHRRSLDGCLGIVQPIDVGKRIFDLGDGVLQVENNEQRDTRLGKSPIET